MPGLRLIVEKIEKLGLERLIFISSMGIYDEIPTPSFQSALRPYRKAAEIIEASNLDYTILRPAWLNDLDEIDYGTTRKSESFANRRPARKRFSEHACQGTLTGSIKRSRCATGPFGQGSRSE